MKELAADAEAKIDPETGRLMVWHQDELILTMPVDRIPELMPETASTADRSAFRSRWFTAWENTRKGMRARSSRVGSYAVDESGWVGAIASDQTDAESEEPTEPVGVEPAV